MAADLFQTQGRPLDFPVVLPALGCKIHLASHCREHPVGLTVPGPRGGEAEPGAASFQAGPCTGECPPAGSIKQDVPPPGTEEGFSKEETLSSGVLAFEPESDECWGLGRKLS